MSTRKPWHPTAPHAEREGYYPTSPHGGGTDTRGMVALCSNLESRPHCSEAARRVDCWYRWAGLLVAVVLVAHTAIRCGLHGNLDLDEAEQLVLVQTWSAGYSAQPPLYTWLLWPVVQLVGANVLALALVKLAILTALFVLMARLARHVLRDDLGALACVTPLLLPVITWEAWRMTHTPLLCVICLATLLIVLRLQIQPRLLHYAALGCCLGLGMLAKYNYAVFALALGLACLVLRTYRPVLRHRGVWLALAVALVMVAPHAVWMLQHAGNVSDYLLVRTGLTGHTPWQPLTLAQGLGSFLASLAIGLSIVLAVVICLHDRQLLRPSPHQPTDAFRLVMVFVLITLALYLGMVILGGMHSFRVHWFAPLLLLIPFWLLSRGHPPAWRRAAYLGSVAVFALVLVGVRGSAFLLDYEDGKYQSRDYLYATLAQELHASPTPPRAVIALDVLSAGYARLHLPECPVLCVHFLTAPITEIPDGDVLLLWDATHSVNVTERYLPKLAARYHWSPACVSDERFVHADRHATLTRTSRLGYCLLRDTVTLTAR